MSGRKASIVARIHGLKHIQCLCAANLAHNDAVRTHTQAGTDQALDVDFFAFSRRCRCIACLKAHDIGDLRNL